MKPKFLVLLLLICAFGCKKDNNQSTTLTIKTMLGRWQVTPVAHQLFEAGKPTRDLPFSTDEHFEYELTQDGKVKEYYIEGNYTSDGQFSLTEESGKQYFTIGISGHSGDLNMGKAEIVMINKNTLKLTFIQQIISLKYVFTETLSRK